VLRDMATRDRVALVAALAPHDRLALLTSMAAEERATVLVGLSAEERLSIVDAFSAKQINALLASFPPAERAALLVGMSPKQKAGVLKGTSYEAELGVTESLSTQLAMPPHLLQLEKFVLLTDEGAVAVRARLNGTCSYLKRQVLTQLHISPRLTLTITVASTGKALPDDAIIAPYADAKDGDQLLLSGAPRPLSDFFPGSATHAPLRQVRVRPTVRGAPSSNAVVIRGVRETTSINDVLAELTKHTDMVPELRGLPAGAASIYFSPVFITPDVLLGRKDKQLLQPTQTLASAQVIDDDILYLAC